MNAATYIDWIALVVGTMGTALWAHNGAYAKYASVLWLLSSCAWLLYAYLVNMAALGARDAISISLYLYGGYRWLKPAKPAAQTP